MNNIISASKEVAGKKGKVDGILYQLEISLGKFIDDVKKSYALNQIGKKTPLVQIIEQTIGQSKIDNLHNFSKEIDEQILYIIDDIVVKFFKTQKQIIKSVYKIKVHNKLNQYYLIVLNEENIDNRSKIFAFLDTFDVTDISIKYPVIFKFTDEKLLQGFFIDKKIDL